ncbi:hypothetical protein HPB51_005717 [Rhipicephalus microplus]|uniref:Fork-head domain-containing protein n=1 Tax=Rhipicephalus microplus TaxID=6941 RepID=A0A9J6EM89_RHIMP|nr:hypothetical protein HPB51_005717 [Rhipicephalus microplus]
MSTTWFQRGSVPLEYFARATASMEDCVEGYSSDSTQASTFMIDKAMPVSPAQTAGRRGRRTTSAHRSSARPRGGKRKSAAASTRAGGSARGRSRRGRAAAFTASPSPKVRHGVHGKPETAEEMALELITEESESRIDVLAEEYVSKITPDPSTTIYADQNCGSSAYAPGSSSYPVYDSSQAEPPATSSQKRRSGRPGRSAPVQRRRRVAIEGDERVVSRPQMGRWSSLLPVGTVVRRPSTKLVQLVAQAIHESPLHLLRVTHVYAALQNRYPYYKLLDNRGINSWKSSVRHALFQKWFVKLCPRSKMSDSLRSKSYFWGLNYNLRPREWVMPQPQPTAFSFPVQGGAGHGEDDEDASLLLSRMHLDNEPPKKALASSTFQPELQESLFSPPETKTLSGRKRRRRTAARASSGGRPSGPPPPVDELARLSSSSPVYHTHLWETDLKTDIKLDSWPEPLQVRACPAALLYSCTYEHPLTRGSCVARIGPSHVHRHAKVFPMLPTDTSSYAFWHCGNSTILVMRSKTTRATAEQAKQAARASGAL